MRTQKKESGGDHSHRASIAASSRCLLLCLASRSCSISFVSRPTLISSRYNPTFRALFARVDPLDYYRERGLALSLRTKLLDLTQLELGYEDARQSSLDTVSGFAFRSSRFPPRPNPPIVPGHLRALSASVSVDSRLRLRSGG